MNNKEQENPYFKEIMKYPETRYGCAGFMLLAGAGFLAISIGLGNCFSKVAGQENNQKPEPVPTSTDINSFENSFNTPRLSPPAQFSPSNKINN